MKKILVSDLSLRCPAGQNAAPLTFRDKVNLASALDTLGLDVIELPALTGQKEDGVVLSTLCGAAERAAAAIPAGDTEEEARLAFSFIREAKHPRLQVILPVSTVQMEYQYHFKAPKMLEKIVSQVKACAALCEDVEFVAQDASRAESDFLLRALEAAVGAGAGYVTLTDDAGILFPDDWQALTASAAGLGAKLFVQPSDQLKMAAASAAAALKAGADGVKVSLKNPEYLSPAVLSDMLRLRGDDLGFCCGLDATILRKAAESLSAAVTAPVQISEDDAVQLSSGATLDEVSAAVRKLGYELDSADLGKVFDEFRRVVEKKESIGARELDAVIAAAAMQVPSTYHLESYTVASGNVIAAMAQVTLLKDGEKMLGIGSGDGPIDAAFRAIEQVIGHHYELDEFRIQAITEGHEALGSSVIRLRDGGKLFAGNGISTDIIGACIRAYINALNKIVYEEK